VRIPKGSLESIIGAGGVNLAEIRQVLAMISDPSELQMGLHHPFEPVLY
jgi:hypothetical protein